MASLPRYPLEMGDRPAAGAGRCAGALGLRPNPSRGGRAPAA